MRFLAGGSRPGWWPLMNRPPRIAPGSRVTPNGLSVKVKKKRPAEPGRVVFAILNMPAHRRFWAHTEFLKMYRLFGFIQKRTRPRRGWRPHPTLGIVRSGRVLLWLLGPLVVLSGVLSAAPSRSRSSPRAIPPATKWDKATAGNFFDDAFTTLDGPRPNFSGPQAKPAAASGGASQPAEEGATGGAAGGFKWSTLVSEDTLIDEIKDLKPLVTKTVASPSDFKGGGYDKAREGFSAIALAFGVIAAYDGDIRWKKNAETARDLFARVGFNCKVGTDQSFAESKLRVADLEALLDGNSLNAKANRDNDFLWNQVAARPALMSRLEVADDTLSAAMAAKSDFLKQAEKLMHEVEIVAVIGEVIQQKDFEHHDDDTYRGYASTMRNAAVKAREATKKGDYDGARAAVGELKKSCDACHGDYRS